MSADPVTELITLEYQAVALLAAPLTATVLGWAARLLQRLLRRRAIASEAARLVAWAQQAIPDKSRRYHEVAALLARRFPALSGEQIEVLIESEVHALKTALARVLAVPVPPVVTGVTSVSTPVAAGEGAQGR